MIRQTQQLSDNAMKVSYLEAGRGVPLVLIHGVGMNAEFWYPQLEALSADYRVIAIDMPGHGESDGFQYAATLEDYVHWLAAFLRTQPEADFAVVGHSMGALITAGLAIDYPDLVNHAIVMSGVFQRSAQAREAVTRRARELASGQARLDSPLDRWFSTDPAEQRLRSQVSDWLHQVNVVGYACAYQAFAAGDQVYSHCWHTLRCPVLVLTGEHDANSNPTMAQQMAQAAPNGRAVIIDNAKHMVSLTDAKRVNEEILNFLNPVNTPACTSQTQLKGESNGRG